MALYKGLYLILFLLLNSSLSGFSTPKEPSKNDENKLNIIIIDPGHGGKDFGASVAGIREKDIVLDIGLKLGNYIEEKFPDIKVIYTRKKDIFIPLNKRAELANKNKADLFLSIHANFVGVKSVSGTETFVLGNHRSKDNLEIAKKENAVILLEENYKTTYEGFDPNSSESYIMFELIQDEYLEQSLQIAAFIQEQFKNRSKRNDRGVKQAGFLVLRETTMPSVLIETGFISNESEKKFMSDEIGRSELAYSIFKAFSDYKGIIESKSSFNLNIENDAVSNTINIKKELTHPAKNETAKIKNETNNQNTNVKTNSNIVKMKTVVPPIKKNNANKKDTIQRELKYNEKETNKTPHPKPKASKKTVIQKYKSSELHSKKKASIIPQKEAVKKNIWFTIQVGVTTKQVKSSPENFKNEKNIYNMKIGNHYKYYSGKFFEYHEAASEKARLRNKFHDAFIVSFENGQLIPIKEAIQKTSK